MRAVLPPARRSCTLLVLGALGLLAGIPSAGNARPWADRGERCAHARTPARRLSLAAARTAVVCLVNQERTERGLPPLTVSSRLNDTAEEWTLQMVHSDSFGHGDPFARIAAVGYRWQAAGENIATGEGTPRAVVAAWMASPDHCQTILNPAYRNVGTGETPHPVSAVARRAATWTQDFGLLSGRRPASEDAAPARACPYR